jgi:hypothetical protein
VRPCIDGRGWELRGKLHMPDLDKCEHCQARLEIIRLKFRFRSVAMVWACSNCAIASVSDVAESSPRSGFRRPWVIRSAEELTRFERVDSKPPVAAP